MDWAYAQGMIDGLSTSLAGMHQASERLHDVANSIAQGNSLQPAETSDAKDLQGVPSSSIPPVAATVSPSPDPSQQWVDLMTTELAFKASAMATRSLIETSQDLMEALR
ncbi:MAG: hypothetical protein N4A65_15340 [Cohaesibacter sp.]|jgi:hypothetical protein|nr:hypothetical protein [Cohaesibacter sp.]